MEKKRLLSILALACFWCTLAGAQETQTTTERGELKSYSFIEVQGGVQHPVGDVDFFAGLTPAVGLNIGHYFSPEAGFRIGAYGWQGQSELKSINESYKWDFFSANVDLLINLTNLFSKTKSHLLNLIFVGGVGLNYVWRSDDLDELQLKYTSAEAVTHYSYEHNRLLYNLQAGLRLESDVTQKLGLSVEVMINNTSDRFNVKVNNHDDWQMTAMVGISYRFGRKFAQKKVVTPAPVVELAPVIEQPKTLHEELVCSSVEAPDPESAKITRAVRFAQENTGASFVVKSYSDASTGTPALNKKYALQRANEVKQALVEQGVSEQLITVTLNDTTGLFNKDVVTIHEEMFYDIRSSEPEAEKLARIAQFVNDNPGATITVKSYADAGTGTSEINAKYAEQRANSAKEALISQGVSENLITATSYGDTVQPFAENDKNRVTILDGTAYRTRILIIIEATTAK